MLFAKEIGEKYGVSGQKVISVIDTYSKDKDIIVPRLFYKTKYGLARVYSKTIWIPAMENAGFEFIVQPQSSLE